jgi:hypothetical protein
MVQAKSSSFVCYYITWLLPVAAQNISPDELNRGRMAEPALVYIISGSAIEISNMLLMQ